MKYETRSRGLLWCRVSVCCYFFSFSIFHPSLSLTLSLTHLYIVYEKNEEFFFSKKEKSAWWTGGKGGRERYTERGKNTLNWCQLPVNSLQHPYAQFSFLNDEKKTGKKFSGEGNQIRKWIKFYDGGDFFFWCW